MNWAPIWIGGGFCRNAMMPGTAASLGRSSSIIWSTLSLRSPRGFKCANRMPVLPPPLKPVAPALEK